MNEPLDKSAARIRRMFGEVARRYDLLNHLLSLNVDRYWRWQAVRKAPPASPGPVLDVCTGTGDLAIAYARLVHRGRRRTQRPGGDRPAARPDPGGTGADGSLVVATDFCHEMLRLGRRKGGRIVSGAGPVFVEADLLNLPFPRARFQVVSVAFGLRNVADTDRALAEMTRVCAPGGKVVVLEFSLPTRQPLRAVYGWYFRRILPSIGYLVSGCRGKAYNYLPASVHAFPAGEALAQRMRNVGLAQVVIHPLTGGIATLYIGVAPP